MGVAERGASTRAAIGRPVEEIETPALVLDLARQPLGVLRSDPDSRATFEAAMREVWSVGRARGIALADDFVAQQMVFLDGLPHEMTSSMHHDLNAGNLL